MEMKEKRRKYEKPRCEVYELHCEPRLLAGSDGSGGFGENPQFPYLP